MKRLVMLAMVAAMAPAAAYAQLVPYGASPQPYQMPMYGGIVPQQGGGISPNLPVLQQPHYYQPAPVYQAPVPQGYGQISPATGQPRTDYVNGYYRADGTYVQPYYRSHR